MDGRERGGRISSKFHTQLQRSRGGRSKLLCRSTKGWEKCTAVVYGLLWASRKVKTLGNVTKPVHLRIAVPPQLTKYLVLTAQFNGMNVVWYPIRVRERESNIPSPIRKRRPLPIFLHAILRSSFEWTYVRVQLTWTLFACTSFMKRMHACVCAHVLCSNIIYVTAIIIIVVTANRNQGINSSWYTYF